MRESKAQSALEFLMTYGWVVVIIVVVLSALYVTGVFKPQTVSRCAFGPELTCDSFSIRRIAGGNVNVTFAFRNAQSDSVLVYNITCVQGANATWSSVGAGARVAFNPAKTLDPGPSLLTATGCYQQIQSAATPYAANIGTSFIGKIFVQWRSSSGTYYHVSEAYLSGLVEPP